MAVMCDSPRQVLSLPSLNADTKVAFQNRYQSSYDLVWLCMTSYDFVWLCMASYDFVWLFMTSYDFVGGLSLLLPWFQWNHLLYNTASVYQKLMVKVDNSSQQKIEAKHVHDITSWQLDCVTLIGLVPSIGFFLSDLFIKFSFYTFSCSKHSQPVMLLELSAHASVSFDGFSMNVYHDLIRKLFSWNPDQRT